ncbi:MAG: TonB-dependent receptor [Candidatus Cryptobacteroides sp.]|nr:TonB-dependent receptor [Candidatus Cryptobacteroides sp.]
MRRLKFFLTVFLLISLWGQAQAQNRVRITGTVTSSEDSQPLVGAAVINSAGNGVITDLDGHYEITADSGSKLVFSCFGFLDVEKTVPDMDPCILDVALETETLKLEDAVVIAYGVRKKGTVTGSVSTVKADKLENTPVPAFDQALQGQVAGLSVLSSTGEPSASATMVIRGTNSINSGTAPLYILDGVAISASDFNTINPADIESMSVLKDASSTSIYGARASNGVIVITTRRGRNMEKSNVSLKAQFGVSSIAYGNWDLMNTAERIQYEKETGMDAGQDYALLSQTDVNWLDAVFNKFAILQNYEVAVSGATDKTNYFVSGAYYNQDGIAPASGFERYSFRTNFEQRLGSKVKMGVNMMLNYQNIQQADEGSYTLVTPISAARFMLPYWNPYREDGSLASISDGSWKGQGQNPLEWIANNPMKYRKYKALAMGFVEADLYTGLTFRSQFSADYSHSTGFGQSFPSYTPNLGEGTASRSSSDVLNLQISNTLTYKFNLSNIHDFTFMLGQEGENYHAEGFSVTGKGQTNDLLTDVAFATRVTSWSSYADSDYARVSFFGRGEYSYSNKYFLEASVRTDGSSRFGKNNRWGVFGAVGFMWNLRNEDFAAPARDWLTNAQISFSSGTAGNSSIPNYEHLELLGGFGNYVGDSAMRPTQPGNEDLTWESCWTTNLGFHAGFWNRLNVDLEFYNKYTTDMLMAVPLSYAQSNGYGYRWENVGGMVNTGVEFNLAADILRIGDFSWNVNANFGYNLNRITELYNGVTEYENANTNTKLVVGHPLGEFYMNRFAGVNPANGDALWYDKDGNITNVLRDSDRVLLGKSCNAPFQGGFGTVFSWKGLSVSAQFSFVAGRYMVNNDRYFDESNGRFATYNQSRRLLERWKQPGDITDIPRHGVFTEFDSRLLEDASFLRLKNLMVSYTFPKVRIYLQGQNLFTVTGFSGLDPEGVANIYAAQYPMSRQFTFGLDLMF